MIPVKFQVYSLTRFSLFNENSTYTFLFVKHNSSNVRFIIKFEQEFKVGMKNVAAYLD